MFKPEIKRTLNRIIPFGLIWLFTGWVFLLSEAAVTQNFRNQPDTAIRMDLPIFIMASISVVVFGMLTGLVEIKILGPFFKNKSFTGRIFYKLVCYLLIFLLIILITFPLAAALEMKTSVFDAVVWKKYRDYFTSVTHLSTTVQLSFSLLLSLFYAEISDYIGQRALSHFLTGKYHRPVEEERVFMFLDMRSSTSLAEQLGHVRYFKLLRNYFADLTAPIIQYSGEVYQYAGDEIIISWPLQKGIAANKCIRCFFAMKGSLSQKKKKYIEQYGVLPEFKAGMHYGKVTTGEIGVIKKEILFTGDVLNTCARIQGLCNTYQSSLLISADLFSQLNLPDKYSIRSLGEVQLKGKDESMELFSISLPEEKSAVAGKKVNRAIPSP